MAGERERWTVETVREHVLALMAVQEKASQLALTLSVTAQRELLDAAKERIARLEHVVYGLCGLILVAVVGALVSLVVRR